ncbi:MAG: gluconeogenesis factor YvcK family protein [Candidatus Omnitrophota bacterium]
MRLSFLKWLYPGMKVKRWILLVFLGVLFIIGASSLFLPSAFKVVRLLGWAVIGLCIIIIGIGISNIIASLINLFHPADGAKIVDIIYQKRFLGRGPKIVTVGGGTGLSVILHGLKEYSNNITAIVTVADDGGSSGRIREEFDILPPGDIRNCLVALADAEPLMRDLFQFRFDKESALEGHSFGNLFITAMTKLTGDFEKAVKESSKILAIRGRVIPATLNKVKLAAEFEDGSRVLGEAKIPKKNVPISQVYLTPEGSQPTRDALQAIQEAEIIVMGPGSLYTSVIPNLLVKGITEAIVASRVPKIYICNVMTQSGETDGYTAYDHVQALISHTHKDVINTCIVNIAKAPSELLERYEKEKSFPVKADSEKIRQMGYRVIEDEIISHTDFVRHDPDKLARIIVGTLVKH